jgi:hypothetical protein
MRQSLVGQTWSTPPLSFESYGGHLSLNARAAIALLGAALACHTEPSESGLTLTGSYGGAIAEGQAYLALVFSEGDDTVEGNGWLSGGGGLGRFLVSGTYSRPDLLLRLTPDNDADQRPDVGSSPLELTGQLQAQTILGSLSGAPDLPVDVALAQVDTTATATFQWRVDGAATLEQRGVANFTIPNELELDFSPGLEANKVVIGGRTGRPPAGVYSISPDSASYQAYVFTDQPGPDGRLFRAVSGDLRVDISTSQALIGSFAFTADEVYGTGRVTVAGSFSAGCGYPQCD